MFMCTYIFRLATSRTFGLLDCHESPIIGNGVQSGVVVIPRALIEGC